VPAESSSIDLAAVTHHEQATIGINPWLAEQHWKSEKEGKP
jgi:hypothetical protein